MKNIINLRDEILVLDKEILTKISARFEIVKEIAKIKHDQHLPIEDNEREKFLTVWRKEQCELLGLNEDVVENIFSIISEESKKLQK